MILDTISIPRYNSQRMIIIVQCTLYNVYYTFYMYGLDVCNVVISTFVYTCVYDNIHIIRHLVVKYDLRLLFLQMYIQKYI